MQAEAAWWWANGSTIIGTFEVAAGSRSRCRLALAVRGSSLNNGVNNEKPPAEWVDGEKASHARRPTSFTTQALPG